MTKEKPWWKQTPVAAPDAPRAVRPPPDDPDDGVEGELGDDDGGDGDGSDGEVTSATSATELADGESTTMRGSGAQPYVLKNTGGVYSCSCPAWRNQSSPLERRSCELVKQQLEAHRSTHARWHPHERCTGLDHLRAELARVEALGGEGLMMRQPSRGTRSDGRGRCARSRRSTTPRRA